MRRIHAVAMSLVLCAACGDDADPKVGDNASTNVATNNVAANNSTTNNSTTNVATNNVATNNANDGQRTLANCGTEIGDGVPAFYAKYFKCSTISLDGDQVVINTANLPPHPSYYYGEGHPNFVEFDTSRGAEYRPNPNLLAEQDVTIRVPLEPTSKGLMVTADMVDTMMNTSQEEYGGGPRGIAIDGVVMFDDQAAPGDDINEEFFTFDSYFGHPAGEMYHYHTSSGGPLEVLESIGLTTNPNPGESPIEFYGIMCDGTLVLGCNELDGQAPEDNLDAQNGHEHSIVDDEGTTHFANRYHTHICVGTYDHIFNPEIQFYRDCNVAGGGPP